MARDIDNSWTAAIPPVGKTITNYSLENNGVEVIEVGNVLEANGVTINDDLEINTRVRAKYNDGTYGPYSNVETIAAVGYDTDYQAWLDYLSANGYDAPSSGQNDIFNARVVNLKAVGAWARTDVIYMFDATYTPTSFAANYTRVNLKTPGSFVASQATVGLQPTFVSGSGWKSAAGDGDYLQTGWIPSTHASNMTTGPDAGVIFSLFDLDTTYPGTSTHISGCLSADANEDFLFQVNSGDGAILVRSLNAGGQRDITQLNINGHYHNYNTGNSDTLNKVSKDGVVLTNTVGLLPSGTPALPSVEYWILAVNNNGVIAQDGGSDIGMGYLILGDAMEDIVTEVYEIMTDTYVAP